MTKRLIARILIVAGLLGGLALALWLASAEAPRVESDAGQTYRGWMAGYLYDQHRFGQYANLPIEGLAGVRLWLPRPVAPGSGMLTLHVRLSSGGPDLAVAQVAAAALAQPGPTDFRFDPLRADPLRGDQVEPLLIEIDSQGLGRANAVSVIGGPNRYANGTLTRDGKPVARADLAFAPIYAARRLDALLPVTRMAQRRPGIFGWPPLYALLAYGLLAALGWLLVRVARELLGPRWHLDTAPPNG